MKTLKLTQLEKNLLLEKEMENVKGGNTCGCGCKYAGSGGSSTANNGNANLSNNLHSGTDHDRILIIEVGPITGKVIG